MMSNPSQIHDTPEDADPMVDALLREFVPADPRNQKRPPDLTSKILRQLAEPPTVEDNKSDDRDVLLDVLLAEFVPSDPNRRIGPPDLTAKIMQRLNDPTAVDADFDDSAVAKELIAGSDQDPVIDSLLTEFVPSTPERRKQPPELATTIVARLTDAADNEPSAHTETAPSVTLPSGNRTGQRAMAVAIAIAASLFFAVWMRDENPVGPEEAVAPSAESSLAMSDPKVGMTSEPPRSQGGVTGTLSPSQNGPTIAALPDSESGIPIGRPDSTPPIRGIPLESPMVAKSDGGSLPVVPDVTIERESRDAEPLSQVATTTRQTARDYWSTLGITPTPAAASHEIAARLKDRLGVVLSEESLAAPEHLRNALASAENSKEITKRWLALAGDSSVSAIGKPENQGLIDEISRGVAGRSDLDVTLVSLVDGSNKHSDRFYETLGRGGPEGIAKRLAGVSMNADLRCVKCHDSHIGRAGTQDDYWSFVSLVKGALNRVDNRWTVAEQPKSVPTFFELPDGRQRMAEARVSHHLLRSDESIGDFRQWSHTLIDSQALAESMVDSLWKLVHGRNLKPSPIDAHAPPVDGKIHQLHRQLADDLRSSGFDVSRTLALIIASPMAQRSVPSALQSESLLTANDQQRSDALDLVGAFAAAVEAPPASRRMLVDVAMRRVGGQLSLDGTDTLLAQPIPRQPGLRSQSDERHQKVSLAERLSVDFPGDQADLPVSWLRSIGDFDQQLEHLVFLSGGDRVTPEIKRAADQFRKAGSDASALSRVWWILRN